jgi:catechol 2,3-dioxygenase-like lactoylglutathione lyase family enzyme
MHSTLMKDRVVTQGMSHIAIRVGDMARSLKFYTGLFNLEATSEGEKMSFLHTPGTNDSFALFRSEGKVVHGGLHHFGFFVDEENFEKALSYVKAHSIEIMEGPGRRGDERYVYIADPDGYRVQISCFGE